MALIVTDIQEVAYIHSVQVKIYNMSKTLKPVMCQENEYTPFLKFSHIPNTVDFR